MSGVVFTALAICCAIFGSSNEGREGGTILAWGHDCWGQCEPPEPNNGYITVAAGGFHSLGLKTDGSIVAWGRNDFSQCDIPLPNSGYVDISCGNYHSMALRPTAA